MLPAILRRDHSASRREPARGASGLDGLDRHPDPDLGAAAGRRRRLDRPAVELDETARDRQTEPAPGRAGPPREAIEPVRQQLRVDPRPGVPDSDLDYLRSGLAVGMSEADLDTDSSARGCVA